MIIGRVEILALLSKSGHVRRSTSFCSSVFFDGFGIHLLLAQTRKRIPEQGNDDPGQPPHKQNDVSPVKNYDPLLPRQNWPRTNPGTLSRMQPLRVAGANLKRTAAVEGRMWKVIVW